MGVRAVSAAELPGLARRIAGWNQRPESCCLHLGSDPGAVLAELTSESAHPLLLVLEGGAGIEALLGADLDPVTGRAWLWGPYFDAVSAAAHGAALFAGLMQRLPAMTRADLFVDESNRLARQWATELGFRDRGRVLIYSAARPGPPAEPGAVASAAEPCGVAVPAHARSLGALHAACFPATYLDAAALIDRADGADEKTYVVAEGDRVLGYVHAGLDDSGGAGFIHFLAVVPEARRRGIGRRLLARATRWLFVERAVPSVDLTVLEGQTDARALYEAAGFALARTGVTSFWTRGDAPAG